ncbi:thiamine diphosphokinase [Rhizobium sp. KVB221]|uniref:Thiamine diphosphokinase n=1 Tax=Rhizobium setariae TaxID=2801340 RepID=A0A936YQA3_9HYPH|nr:thiamine diphosphokinase [Rhizobium setariae]MBL0374755.1 thiamine diphosphokinase [Rhizobium setariae]
MTTFAILLGGAMRPTDRLVRQLDGARFIAADGGMRHAETLNVRPDLWVGDFDSVTPELVSRYAGIERETYPAEKALTDGEIAIAAAISRGASRLILVGALGGERTDHGMAHFVHATALAAQGWNVQLTSGDEEAYPLVGGQMTLNLPAGSLFSIIGFEDLTGLTIENARYPLENFFLPFGSSRTLSNVAEGAITIRLGTGRAMVFARPYDFSGV